MDDVLQGRAAPPSANGELVFEEPWEGRVFGLARSLSESGHFEWDAFRERLIAAIERWEQRAPEGADYHYYDHFLEALEATLAEKDLIARGELTKRFEQFLARPHGHDHSPQPKEAL